MTSGTNSQPMTDGWQLIISILPQLGIQPEVYSSLSFQMSQQFSSVQFSHSVVPNSLWPCGLQHIRPPCPSPTPGACSNSYPSSQWCHPTISSSVILFSFCPQSFLASGYFPMSQLFESGGQSIGASASASSPSNKYSGPINIQGWFPLGLTGLISLLSKGLSRVFSQKRSIIWLSAFFMVQLLH